MKMNLPDSWSWKKVRQVADVVSGATPRRDVPAYWNGNVPWITPKEIGGLEDPIVTRTEECITEEGYQSASCQMLPIGTVLLSSRAPIGHLAITGLPVCTNQGFKNLVPKKGTYSKYLYWAVRARKQDLVDLGRGATFKEVSKAIVEEFELPFPSDEDEQKRIAAVLDKADALRRKRQEALRLTDDFLRASFLDMFGDPVTNPKCFEIASLGSLCDVRDGTHDSPKYVSDGYPLLTSKNFKNGKIDFLGANKISRDDFIQINRRSKVDLGDLIMPMIGTIGNPVLVSEEPQFAIKNVALIKFTEASPDRHYIHTLLCSHYFEHATASSNRGGTQKFVALGDLRKIPVPVPTEELQQRYRRIVLKLTSIRDRLEQQAFQQANLFSALQQRAFRGEL